MKLEFGSKGTEDIFKLKNSREASKTAPSEVHSIAVRKLDQMESVRSVEELSKPPGNRLEKLKGNLQGFYSIRINNQFRIIFRTTENAFTDITIVDYH